MTGITSGASVCVCVQQQFLRPSFYSNTSTEAGTAFVSRVRTADGIRARVAVGFASAVGTATAASGVEGGGEGGRIFAGKASRNQVHTRKRKEKREEGEGNLISDIDVARRGTTAAVVAAAAHLVKQRRWPSLHVRSIGHRLA